MLYIPALQNLDNLRAIIPPEILIWLANTPEGQLPAVINVAIVDQLCAYMDPGKRHALGLPGPEQISVGNSFAKIVPGLLLIAASAGAVLKMEPNVGDGFTGSPDELRSTWTHLFVASNKPGFPDWSNVKISGMERTEMYDFIGQKAHFIIRTHEIAGWANVVLQLDPRQLSQMLKDVLPYYRLSDGGISRRWSPIDYVKHPIALGEALEYYGHGNGLLFVSQQALTELSIDLSKYPHRHGDGTVAHEFTLGTKFSLPDTYPQHANSPLQRAIGTFGVGENELVFPSPWLKDPLGDELQPSQLRQELSLDDLRSRLQDPRQVYVNVCKNELGAKAVFFTKGIPGAKGGIGI